METEINGCINIKRRTIEIWEEVFLNIGIFIVSYIIIYVMGNGIWNNKLGSNGKSILIFTTIALLLTMIVIVIYRIKILNILLKPAGVLYEDRIELYNSTIRLSDIEKANIGYAEVETFRYFSRKFCVIEFILKEKLEILEFTLDIKKENINTIVKYLKEAQIKTSINRVPSEISSYNIQFINAWRKFKKVNHIIVENEDKTKIPLVIKKDIKNVFKNSKIYMLFFIIIGLSFLLLKPDGYISSIAKEYNNTDMLIGVIWLTGICVFLAFYLFKEVNWLKPEIYLDTENIKGSGYVINILSIDTIKVSLGRYYNDRYLNFGNYVLQINTKDNKDSKITVHNSKSKELIEVFSIIKGINSEVNIFIEEKTKEKLGL